MGDILFKRINPQPKCKEAAGHKENRFREAGM